jgi:hypothetical protein
MCLHCNDIFNLTYNYRECECKRTSGCYQADGLTATVFTTRRSTAVVLGFANQSFTNQLVSQHNYGDSKDTMPYMGKIVTKGRDFKAFIIPESADTVIWEYTENA